MATLRIEEPFKVTEFDGELLAKTSTRSTDPSRPSARWVDFYLYSVESAEGRPAGYLLHRVGQSTVYHQPDTECSTITGQPSGEPAKASQLPAGATSCDRCQPPWPEDLDPEDSVRMETQRHTIDRCQTPAQVISRLTSMRERGIGSGPSTRTSVLSAPAAELLATAAAADPEFSAGAKPVERLG